MLQNTRLEPYKGFPCFFFVSFLLFFRLWLKELVDFELRFEFCTSKTSPGTISHAWKLEISGNISLAIIIIVPALN